MQKIYGGQFCKSYLQEQFYGSYLCMRFFKSLYGDSSAEVPGDSPLSQSNCKYLNHRQPEILGIVSLG